MVTCRRHSENLTHIRRVDATICDMGLLFNRRKRTRYGTVNLSKSGVSLSRKAGPFTFSSRGRGSIRLGKGISFRFKI